MFLFKKEHIGSKIEFYSGTQNVANGVLLYESNTFFIASNNPVFHGGNKLIKPVPGMPYVYSLGVAGKFPLDSGPFVGITSLKIQRDYDVIFKNGSSGMQFRRVFDRSNGMIFLGPIKKDYEQCFIPAGLITVQEESYIKAAGWNPYVKEGSAESRAKKPASA